MQHYIEAMITMIAIVPNWLQEPLSVLLEASEKVRVIGSASSLEELPSIEAGRAPDLVLIYADGRDDEAVEQIRQTRARWPGAHLIALVEHSGQCEPAKAAGANQVMIKGVSPRKLLETIQDAHATCGGLDTPAPQATER